MTGNLVAAAPESAATTVMVGGGLSALFCVAVYCWYAAALAALFVKMGAPKWKAWVPVVSQMEVLERSGRPAWHVVTMLVPIYGLWVWAQALHRINQSFGRGAGYTVLALLLPPVWASLLGWGSDQPDFEPQRMYPAMAPSMGRGPLAAPESVPMWAGAPMATSASLAPGQPWAPAAPQAGGFAGSGQAAAAPSGHLSVLHAPMPDPAGPPAMFGIPGQPVAPGEPGVFGQPVAPGEPGVFGQPVAPGEPGVFGQPVAPGQPAAPGELGQPDPGRPWPQEQVPWPQSSDPSTLVGQFPVPDSAPAPYAPQPVDLASLDQPDPALAAPSGPTSTEQPAQPSAAASAPAVPGYGPVPDPRFAASAPAAAPPVSLVPDPALTPPVAAAGAHGGEGLLVPPPPGAVLPAVPSGAASSGQPTIPPVAVSVAGAPAPVLEPVAPLPATSLPSVSVPLTLVDSSSDAQQTVVIPFPDEDIDGTVVVRRPTFQPWVLSLDDGRTFVVRSRSVVLGRRPESVDLGVQVLTITDDGRTISKTHARLDLVDDVWRVVDMGSTNGVVTTDADGEEVDVEPGKATPVYGRLVLGAVGMRLTPGGSA